MSEQPNSHEKLSSQNDVKVGSDRSFGLVFAGVFLILGVWLSFGQETYVIWPFAASAVFLALALVFPRALHGLNVIWFKFGMLLHSIVNPIIMALMFFLVITPMGLVMRLFGKDLLRLKLDGNEKSFWIDRTPPGPAPESMKNQF